ncbi:cytochrome P450 [Streptomyces sp. NPDC058426]|uniref:cytochrome P450 n=1 Tax=Streptomyces sp. NPDC058426 TaxID=3346493 RepID=UPI0036469F63
MSNRYVPGATPLYEPEFAADPHAAYARLRARHGAVAPVEVAPGVGAHLVLDYRAAWEILTDQDGHWSKDPRPWEASLPSTPEAHGVLGMIGYRPNALFTDGEVHDRFRQAVSDCFRMIQPHRLRATVTEIADDLVREFAAEGRADLVGQYARPLMARVINRLYGRSDASGRDLDRILTTLSNAVGADAVAANEEFGRYMNELITAKYESPGDDLPSWFIGHPAQLAPEEVVQHVVLTLGAGNEPSANLISNTTARMLTDERYYSSLTDGALSTREALAEVLRTDPSMANYGPYFATRPVHFHGTWIQPAELVLVSYAGAGSDPTGLPAHADERSDGGAHLGFGAGEHRCPAADPALLIAATGIDRLLTLLPGLELAVPFDELTWRPGPFHRALAALPVTFRPVRPDQPGVTPWTNSKPSLSTL